MCRNPYMTANGHAFGCGQCMPCRVNRRRTWSHRILLESVQHESNAFLTLTYRPEEEPQSVEVRDMQLFIKRLRFTLSRTTQNKVRYYGVGEYGGENGRPHYHIAVFGGTPCARGRTLHRPRQRCCDACDAIADTWGKGRIDVGEINPSSAAYLAGYITKAMTSVDDPRLLGRKPEFARMSLRPGIGAYFMDEVASTLMEHRLEGQSDVPSHLGHGRSRKGIGAYLRRRLRTRVGKAAEAPQETLVALWEELSPLRARAKEMAGPEGQGYTAILRSLILEENEGRYRNLEAKQRLAKKREVI